MTDERFQEYVEEFRAFSRFHKVAYGRPHDLLLLRDTLESSERFRVEMASMVRSVFYRERGGVTQAGVAGILAVAWGGEQGEEPDAMAMAAKLGDFVREVLSRPAGEPPPLVVVVEEEEDIAEAKTMQPRQQQAAMAAALTMKAKEDSGETPVRKVAPIHDSPERADEDLDDPWADGSFLHRELLQFAEWRANR